MPYEKPELIVVGEASQLIEQMGPEPGDLGLGVTLESD